MALTYRLEAVKPRKGWVQPTKDDYVSAFKKLSDDKVELLKIQVACPGYAVTARQLAGLANYKSYHASNLRYGNLGKEVSQILKVNPAYYWGKNATNWWSIISNGCAEMEEYLWIMRPEAVAACEELAWTKERAVFMDPVERGASEQEFREGKSLLVPVTVYERSERCRLACIKHYGCWKCQICGFDFFESYGEIGKEFIHVHHLNLLCTLEKEHLVNPITDLLPVCPNCHSMLHKRTPPFSPEELRETLRNK